MITLAELLEAQHALQVDSFNLDPLELDDEERIEFLRWNVLALVAELNELLEETGWKPWATSRHVNEDAATGEVVDALHFIMNIMMVIAPRGSHPGLVAKTIGDRYMAKRAVNAERQADGYDGVSGKCDSCHRDLAEVALMTVNEPGCRITACVCGHVLRRELV